MATKTTKTLHSGYLSKVGAKVKNWKLRYMVLFGNGKLQYYKKPPVNIDTEEPQGLINVQADVVELILWDDVITKGLVKWPSAAIPQSGFAMRTRQGRVYQVHAESVEASDKWIAAVRSVGANIVMYYSRDILQLASISNSAGSQISLGFAKALGTAIAFAAVDRCGRRLLLIVGVSGAIVGHLGMAVAFVPGLVEVAPTLAWASLLLFLAAWDLGWASLMSVVISEILPDDVRGVGLGASCSLYWLVSFVQAQTLETLFKSITIAGTFFMYCGASIIGLLFVLIYVPETCGRPLETA